MFESVCTDVSYSGRTDRSLLPELLERNGLPSDNEHLERLSDRYTKLLPEVLSRRGGTVLPGTVDLLESIVGRVQPSLLCDDRESSGHGNSETWSISELLRFFRGIFGGDHDSQRKASGRADRVGDPRSLRRFGDR